jgi:hypothetical protein
MGREAILESWELRSRDYVAHLDFCLFIISFAFFQKQALTSFEKLHLPHCSGEGHWAQNPLFY